MMGRYGAMAARQFPMLKVSGSSPGSDMLPFWSVKKLFVTEQVEDSRHSEKKTPIPPKLENSFL